MANYQSEKEQENINQLELANKVLTHPTQKKGYFSSFLLIFQQIFSGEKTIKANKKLGEKSAPTFHTHEEELLWMRANQFLSSSNEGLFFQMVQNGYVPDEPQKQKFNDYIRYVFSSHLLDSNTWQTVENYLSYGFELDKGLLEDIGHDLFRNVLSQSFKAGGTNITLDLLINSEETIYFYEWPKTNKKHFPLITQQLRDVVQQPEFGRKYFFTLTNHDLTTPNRLLQEALQYNGHILLADISFDEFMSFINKIPGGSPSNLRFYNSCLHNYYQNDINGIMNHTKEAYGTQYVEKMTLKEVQSSISASKKMELPPQVRELLDNISALYQKIYGYTHDAQNQVKPELMNADMVFEVTNLFEKRLPEILKKYLTIDNEYRTTLTNNQGKNAETLMLESLTHIHENFTHHLESINQQKVQDLSISNRYTQKFKS